jgi:hypothetical protein
MHDERLQLVLSAERSAPLLKKKRAAVDDSMVAVGDALDAVSQVSRH